MLVYVSKIIRAVSALKPFQVYAMLCEVRRFLPSRFLDLLRSRTTAEEPLEVIDKNENVLLAQLSKSSIEPCGVTKAIRLTADFSIYAPGAQEEGGVVTKLRPGDFA